MRMKTRYSFIDFCHFLGGLGDSIMATKTKIKTSTFVLPLSALRWACSWERYQIQEEWPDGIPSTRKSVERAIELDLSLSWAAQNLLSGHFLREYNILSDKAYVRYCKTHDKAYEECRRIVSRTESKRVRAKARKEFYQFCNESSKKYHLACGLVLLRLLKASKQRRNKCS